MRSFEIQPLKSIIRNRLKFRFNEKCRVAISREFYVSKCHSSEFYVKKQAIKTKHVLYYLHWMTCASVFHWCHSSWYHWNGYAYRRGSANWLNWSTWFLRLPPSWCCVRDHPTVINDADNIHISTKSTVVKPEFSGNFTSRIEIKNENLENIYPLY